MISTSTAGEFLSLLLKPLDQRVESDGSQAHERELKATALNNIHYPPFLDDFRKEEEYYDLAFVFPAHSIDSSAVTENPGEVGLIGLQSMRHLLSQICVYRTVKRAELDYPRTAYSLAFHDRPAESPTGIQRLATKTWNMLVPRRRVHDEPLLEMTHQRRERRNDPLDPTLSPPLIALGSEEFISGGVDSLSSFYRLENILEQSARCRWLPNDVHLILRSVFVECLQKLGAHTSTLFIDSKVIIRARLSERASQDAAEQLEYHLRVSPLLRRKGNDKYAVYDSALPPNHWASYDGLSRLIRDPIGNPHGSMFRDIDRMRLLMLQIQAHFNLGVLCSDFELTERLPDNSALILKPTLLDYFPLHRIHLQQYFCDSGASLSTKIHDRLDDELRCNYYGEEIASYFIWTKYLLWSLFGPILFGLIHSLVKLAAITYSSKIPSIQFLEIAFSICHVVYLSVWTEWVIGQWVSRISNRIKRPSMKSSASQSVSLGAYSSPAVLYRRNSSNDINYGSERIAKDFERSDYEFDYYKVTKEGEYLKYEDPRNRRRKRVLSRLLTAWLYLSLTTCLVLTFYARAQTPTADLESSNNPMNDPTFPDHNSKSDNVSGFGVDASSQSARWMRTLRSLIMPLLSRVQILNYLQTGIIMFFDKLWVALVPRILSLENHRLETDYRFSLVSKSYYFKFLNHFLPLLYSAIITRSHIAFQNQLIIQVVSLIATDFVGVFQVVFNQLRFWRKSTGQTEDRQNLTQNPDAHNIPVGGASAAGAGAGKLSALVIQCEMPAYDLAELTQHFIDVMLQLTHVLIFAPICPIVSIFTALRCLLQILVHNYKLALLYKRLITHDYPRILESVILIISNASGPLALALLLYAEPSHTFKQKLIAFVVLQNLLLAFKMIARYNSK